VTPATSGLGSLVGEGDGSGDGVGLGDGSSEGVGLGEAFGVGVGFTLGFGFGVGVGFGSGGATTVVLSTLVDRSLAPPHITISLYWQLEPLQPSLQITEPSP
jgi:hypothetical protein